MDTHACTVDVTNEITWDIDMMAYVDMLIGALALAGYVWIITSAPWHSFMHRDSIGMLLRGRLWCGYCARREQNVTRDEWRDEALDRIRRLL